MSRRIIKFHFSKLVKMIVATLLNKYDFFIVIEGGTGIGKSTLAYLLASRVAREFKSLFSLNADLLEYYYERVGRGTGLTEQEFIDKILRLKEEKAYRFSPRKCLVYTQDELQKALASWHQTSIPDEMINITFNRDFYSEKQKDIIKMLNMFRDHENLTIACVPQFQFLDNQIKNLCKMKITVKKRGIGIIHTPNSTVYCKDKWDQATNEKIEREWIIKKMTHPNYSKLTTFRGLVKFPPLSKGQERRYQKIKNDKRSVVLRDEMHIKVTDEEDPLQKFVKKLVLGEIRNGITLDGYAMAIGLKPNTFRAKITRELEKLGKPLQISHYYYDRKAKDKPEIVPQEFAGI